MTDPVCGMKVDPHTTKHRATYRGQTFYFCSERCREKFMAGPEQYLIGREKAEHLQVAKLNIDDNPDVARRYGIMSIPTLMLFVDGQEKARLVGARGKDALLREIDPHLS